jgi:O-acetylhomoserine/O-acetylserine sulfhydrylase-like pyridoxal-dependent enzyme
MKSLPVAVGLVAVGVAAAVVLGNPDTVVLSTELSGGTVAVLQLEGIQDLIERIDAILESVVDLLRTIGQLFGEGGGGE